MFATRAAQCVTFILLSFLVLAQISAAPILMAELTFEDGEFGATNTNVPNEARMEFGISGQGIDGFSFGRWSRNISAADVGQTYYVEPDQLALMAHAIVIDDDDNVQFFVGLFPTPANGAAGSHYEFPEHALLAGTVPWASLALHTSSLRSHPLAAVTITIDSLRFIQEPEQWLYGGGFTARLYGVPEPSSCALLVAAMLCFGCHFRGTPHQAVFPS